ncbi:MAG: EF-hand domain-containing protein [Methylophilaceae bacterium]
MMTFNTSNTFKALAVATIFACGVTAQTAMAETKDSIKVAAAAPADADFAKLDKNKDGKISLKEAAKDKSLSASFDAVDANKDGYISSEEYATYKSAMSGTAAPIAADPTAPMTEPAPAK